MNFGFFGIQYSFGLQQTNMSPIYSYLGADPENLPFLWLAGPMTGLIVGEFNECYHGKTGEAIGIPRCTWSGSGYLMAHNRSLINDLILK
jgi:hypothetical protein